MEVIDSEPEHQISSRSPRNSVDADQAKSCRDIPARDLRSVIITEENVLTYYRTHCLVVDLRYYSAPCLSPVTIKQRAATSCGPRRPARLDIRSLVAHVQVVVVSHLRGRRLAAEVYHLSFTVLVIMVDMFKRTRITTARCSTPTAPKINSVRLPSFGGRGYESDSYTKTTPALKRSSVAEKSPAMSPRGVVPSKMRNVHTSPQMSSPLQREPPLVGSKPITIRRRNDSITSVSTQSGSTSWGGSFTDQRDIDAPWASGTSSSWGGSSTSLKKDGSFDEFRSSFEGPRSRKSSFTAPSKLPTRSGGGAVRDKLLDVNVSIVPMKQEVPTSVHWQLIPYSLRQHLGRPRLYFDLASDLDDNNICFDNVYPRRSLTAKDLDKTASDVEQMMIRCDDLPKWAGWHVVVNCSKKDHLINCGLVFREIHKAFNLPMTESEMGCIPSSEKKDCERAFGSRCERSAGLTAWNKKQGMKRVDYLRGKTFYNGLSFDMDQAIWVLHLARSP